MSSSAGADTTGSPSLDHTRTSLSASINSSPSSAGRPVPADRGADEARPARRHPVLRVADNRVRAHINPRAAGSARTCNASVRQHGQSCQADVTDPARGVARWSRRQERPVRRSGGPLQPDSRGQDQGQAELDGLPPALAVELPRGSGQDRIRSNSFADFATAVQPRSSPRRTAPFFSARRWCRSSPMAAAS